MPDETLFVRGLLLFSFRARPNRRTKADARAVGRVPQAFSDAWAKHEGPEFEKIMTDDVDFLTLAAACLNRRADS